MKQHWQGSNMKLVGGNKTQTNTLCLHFKILKIFGFCVVMFVMFQSMTSTQRTLIRKEEEMLLYVSMYIIGAGSITLSPQLILSVVIKLLQIIQQ